MHRSFVFRFIAFLSDAGKCYKVNMGVLIKFFDEKFDKQPRFFNNLETVMKGMRILLSLCSDARA